MCTVLTKLLVHRKCTCSSHDAFMSFEIWSVTHNLCLENNRASVFDENSFEHYVRLILKLNLISGWRWGKKKYRHFMYNSAVGYIIDNCMSVLAETFGEWVISLGLCPASSPDLNNPVTIICGAHEQYVNNSHLLRELKENIHWELFFIPRQEVFHVYRNVFFETWSLLGSRRSGLVICTLNKVGHTSGVEMDTE